MLLPMLTRLAVRAHTRALPATLHVLPRTPARPRPPAPPRGTIDWLATGVAAGTDVLVVCPTCDKKFKVSRLCTAWQAWQA